MGSRDVTATQHRRRISLVVAGCAALCLTAACQQGTTAAPAGPVVSRDLPEVSAAPIPRPTIDSCGGAVPADYLFDLDSSALRPETGEVLESVVDTIHSVNPRRITVLGFTDGLGSEEHNLVLSLDRANSVRAWLVDNGVAADRIETRGEGMDAPAGVSDPSKRRVEFTFEPAC